MGLSPPERGSLVHAALAAFWTAIKDRAALLNLDPAMLAARIEAAVQAGLAVLPQTRWRSVPALVLVGETRRVAAVLAAWLAIERTRPPFVVRDIEELQTFRLSGLEFRLRLDRIDALADGGLAILDYKTGRVEKPAQWFDARPRAAQLGMYTLAQRAAAPELPLRAVAYVQLCPGDVRAAGLAADENAWPGLAAVSSVGPHSDWRALETWWQARLGVLTQEIAEGYATVTPRASPSPCRNCGLQAVCRIESARRTRDSDADE
jgi:hypothetical protein